LSIVVLGASVTVAPTEVYACNGCWKKAKAMYPHDLKERRAYRKECKAAYKAWRRSHRKHRLFG
jgi:hypothetical protein